MLDEGVQVLGGVRVERRRQDAAVAQGARAELHAAVHPGDDLVVVQLRDGGIDHFVGGEQVAEPQLAVFEHLLDLAGGEGRAQAERFHAGRGAPAGRRVCQVSSTAPMAVPALPAAGCTKTLPLPKRCSSADTSSAFSPSPPARHRFSAAPGHPDHGLFDGPLDARGDVGAQRFGNRAGRPPGRAVRRTAS